MSILCVRRNSSSGMQKKKHPYNDIVEKWRRIDLLGLTATPAQAESTKDDSTKEKIRIVVEGI